MPDPVHASTGVPSLNTTMEAAVSPDGITEASNPTGDDFGEQRLAGIIAQQAHLSLEELRERILREVGAFVGTAPQQDDMTMLLLKVEDVGVPA